MHDTGISLKPVPQQEREILLALFKDLAELVTITNENFSVDFIEEIAFVDMYWSNSNRYACFIQNYKEQIAGFVLVNDYCEVEQRLPKYAIAEFYIKPAYRSNSVGQIAFKKAVALHKGYWEVRVHANNDKALQFWQKVVEANANNFSISTSQSGQNIILFHNF